MDKETVELFGNDYVRLDRQKPSDNRPSIFLGRIKAVYEDSILFQYHRQDYGMIMLADIVMIARWDIWMNKRGEQVI